MEFFSRKKVGDDYIPGDIAETKHKQSWRSRKSSTLENLKTSLGKIQTVRDEPRPYRGLSYNAPLELVTPERVEDISEMAANNMVDGMVAQDREDFETACFHFSIALRSMFPEYDGERIFKASEAYTSALFAGSRLKDDNKLLAKEATLHDDRWESVRSDLTRMCEFLDIPKSYATETTEWFRYHGIRDDDYVKHLLESHRVFLKRVVGNDRFYRELSGLYLTGIALHDKHDKHVYALGKELMRIYFSIIFKEKYGSQPTPTAMPISSASA